MKEYLKMLWSDKLDFAERILARAEYKALAKADIEIDRKQGTIKMLDVTMQIVKRL
jgi:predicted ATP-grasp superfamily ATP-dependent carboligase